MLTPKHSFLKPCLLGYAFPGPSVISKPYHNGLLFQGSPCQSHLSSPAAQETILQLQKFGISKSDIVKNPSIFHMPLNFIEQRLQFLAEGGLKTDLTCIPRFEEIASSTLAELRLAKLLPELTDVIGELMSVCKYGTPPSTINMKASYESIHRQFLCHVFNDIYGTTFPVHNRFRRATIHTIFSNFNLLEEECVPTKWILGHPTLLCFADSRNLRKLFDVEKIYSAPVSFSSLIKHNANFSFLDVEDYFAILFLLMKYQISKRTISRSKTLDYFFLPPQEFAEGLEKLSQMLLSQTTMGKKKKPSKASGQFSPADGSWQHELACWMNANSKVLNYSPDTAQPTSLSQTGIYLPVGRYQKVTDYIANVLNIDQEEVKIEISKIRNAKSVKVCTAHDTFNVLLEHGFKVEEIKTSLQLLLYPRNIVEKALTKVFLDPVYGNKRYQRKHLQLCLYHILMQFKYELCYSSEH